MVSCTVSVFVYTFCKKREFRQCLSTTRHIAFSSMHITELGVRLFRAQEKALRNRESNTGRHSYLVDEYTPPHPFSPHSPKDLTQEFVW
jgi:hypothetical protein